MSQLAGNALLRRVCAFNVAFRVFICCVSLMGLNKWLREANSCSVFFCLELKVQGLLGARSLSSSLGPFFPLTHQFMCSSSPVSDREFI